MMKWRHLKKPGLGICGKSARSLSGKGDIHGGSLPPEGVKCRRLYVKGLVGTGGADERLRARRKKRLPVGIKACAGARFLRLTESAAAKTITAAADNDDGEC